MNVTFCAYDWPGYIGGPNTGISRLLPELKQRGIQSTVLFFTYHGKPEVCPTVIKLRQMGFDCPAVYTPVYMEDRVRWLLRRVREDPPDIFIPDGMVPAFYAGRWVREAGIPTVGVLRSDDPFYRALRSGFVFGDAAYRPSALVCVSQFLEQEVLGRHQSDIIVRRIPSGAPLPTRIVQPPTKNNLRLIYSGRLDEEQKRISDVTRALCQAVRLIPGTEAVIYGDGSAASSVKQILAEEGDGLPVHLAGKVESSQIQECLLESHVLVLLSDYEGLSISLMEAMACGVVPVCLRMRSGVPELVEHEGTGLLVNDRVDDFITAVRRLRQEPDLWARLSRAARAKIETGYTVEESALRWQSLFTELLEKSETRREVQIPKHIVLPPAHPDLVQGDLRKPPILKLYARGIWRLARRIILKIPVFKPLKKLRNYIISGVAAFPWSRKLLNAVYLRLTPAQRSRFHQEFAKIYKYRSIQGRGGSWDVRFGGKLIRIPLSLDQFWLDWDTALTVVGQDVEIRETYAAMINSPDKPEIFIDVGTNYGTHSLLFLVQGIKTISFEPNSTCHAYIKRLCEANQVTPNLQPVALGDRPGKVMLSYPKNETWLGSTDSEVARKLALTQELVTEEVEQKTLDDYIEQIGNTRTLIKIDTEGHELAVLQGALRTLEEVRPIIIFECWDNIQRRDLFNFLEMKRYRICELPWSPRDVSLSLSLNHFLSSSAVNFIAAPE